MCRRRRTISRPSGPVTRGVETEITAEIEYTLETADESAVNVGFNSEEPNKFKMREHIDIHRGTDRLQVKLTIIPVDGRAGEGLRCSQT